MPQSHMRLVRLLRKLSIRVILERLVWVSGLLVFSYQRGLTLRSNATELIISIIALFQGQTDITKLSLLGSVFSNLVVLPTACIIGAPNFIAQNFNINSVRTHTFLLVVGAGILCLTSSAPTIDSFTSSDVTVLSRVMSITLILAYVIFIFIYRLWTHKKELEAEVQPSEQQRWENISASDRHSNGQSNGSGAVASDPADRHWRSACCNWYNSGGGLVPP
jgi:calcium/proton exchanger cax